MSHLAKALERLIIDQFVDYLERNNLINSHQSGFRKNFISQSVLLKLTDIVHRGIELGFVTILLMIYFSKAFDTLDHTILVRKLYI